MQCFPECVNKEIFVSTPLSAEKVTSLLGWQPVKSGKKSDIAGLISATGREDFSNV